MKGVRLVLSVVAMVEDDKGELVYQTEKIFGGERVKFSTEAQLVTELIGAASGGVAMKPDTVKTFKDALSLTAKEASPASPVADPSPDKGGNVVDVDPVVGPSLDENGNVEVPDGEGDDKSDDGEKDDEKEEDDESDVAPPESKDAIREVRGRGKKTAAKKSTAPKKKSARKKSSRGRR